LDESDFPVPPERIRQIFLQPKVTDRYELDWRSPSLKGVVDFLCGERDFSEDRVQKAIEKMTQGLREIRERRTLEQFFG
nr:flap structure-specific endonuclease [Candidatus Bathyarchaeota archaeon]NIU81405.1 flap structure-specific endonuclease [Candidatus Bathyarchaeota archaeon]NIV67464.1 flap structure-specific endonuclease [Candidatus Bathyarchaeota archaeon]NIW16432.1 flap structure-specific endonuclease [Candidatus Bathyarchaeota archaeon]NIW34103.1 flap structure-specific endonuclease [Candidatus Bathyarchaeota archaeon]